MNAVEERDAMSRAGDEAHMKVPRAASDDGGASGGVFAEWVGVEYMVALLTWKDNIC